MGHYMTLQENYFRVLELEAAARGTNLRGRLIHLPLDPSEQSYPSYEALSYVWGTDAASHPLNLMPEYVYDQCSHPSTLQSGDAESQHTTVLIGTNLKAALEKLRYQDTSRFIWVDALCINQNDYAEKASQIQQMLPIYAGAEQVVAFLGEDADNGSLLFRMFEESYQAQLNPELLVVVANGQRPPRLSLRAPDLHSRLLNAYSEDAAATNLKNILLAIGGRQRFLEEGGFRLGVNRFILFDDLIYVAPEQGGYLFQIFVPQPFREEFQSSGPMLENPVADIFANATYLWPLKAGDASNTSSATDSAAMTEEKKSEWKMPASLERDIYDHIEDLKALYKCLMRFLSRRWFQRVWIIQEAVVARKLVFQLGGSAVSFFALRHAVYSMNYRRVLAIRDDGEVSLSRNPWDIPAKRHKPSRRQHIHEGAPATETSSALETALQGRKTFAEVTEMRQWFAEGRTGDLLSLLWQFRHMKATWSRDHIFSLTRLIKESGHELLRPDYTRPLWEVVSLCARFCIENDPDPIRMLYAARGITSKSQDEQVLPSWTPDWFRDPGDSVSDSDYYGATYRFWHKFFDPPGGYYQCSTKRKCQIGIGPRANVLAIHGFIFDRVRTLGEDHWSTEKVGESDERRLRRWIDESNTFIPHLEHYPTGEKASEVLRKTFVGNRSYSESGIQPLADNGEGPQSQNGTQGYVKFRSTTVTDRLDPAIWKILSAQCDAYWSWAESLAYLKYCLTEKGYFGVVPLDAEIGDDICFFCGSCVPFVLRSEGGPATDAPPAYKVVGKCYIHGIMEGEAMNSDLPESTFVYLV